MHKVGRQLTRTRNCKIAPAQPISALKGLYIKARHVVQAEVDHYLSHLHLSKRFSLEM